MQQKRIEALFKEFPNLYQDLFVECGSGWYSLIYQLSKDITELDPEGMVKAVQVKEKFGGLRFYINGASDEIYDLITRAELDSTSICERCGDDGNQTGTGWIRTLCKPCRKEREDGRD